MNKLDIIKKISDKKLVTSIHDAIGGRSNIDKYKKIVWGAGVSGKNFVQMHSDMGFSYIVDSRTELQGLFISDVPVLHPDNLYSEIRKDQILIFLPTVIHKDINELLIKNGFSKIVVPNQLNTSGVGFNINRKDVLDIFQWLNDRNVNYTFLKVVPGSFIDVKDVDILIAENQIDNLLECPLLATKPANDKIYLDVSFSSPIGINAELPFYPQWLSEKILDSKNTVFVNGIRSLNGQTLLLCYIFHVLIHKGTSDSLKKNRNIFVQLQKSTGIYFPITLEGMWRYIRDSDFWPGLDFIRKWAAHNNSEFLKRKTAIEKSSGSQLAVFVFRDFFRSRERLLSEVRNNFLSENYIEKGFVFLTETQAENVRRSIRGGVWEDSYQSKLGGGPYAIGIYKPPPPQ